VPAETLKTLRSLVPPLRVKPGAKVRLPHDFDTEYTAKFRDREHAEAALAVGVDLLRDLQPKLAAQERFALVVVLQGMDAAGKDSTIKHVMSGLNPQGVTVRSFKVPSNEELLHDYLWRYARELPSRGMIGMYNRSHYEEVLIVRVHPELLGLEHLPPPGHRDVWQQRFDEINNWERYLVDNGIEVLKLFLNVSKEEQRRRFLERLDNPDKTWKFTLADVRERRFWDDYQQAYSEVLSHTSTEWAPWHVIPADHKWFARLAAAASVLDALERLRPMYPRRVSIPKAELERARAELEAE
jgi:PPK2 family polyphosphate:nucleotide phosphotransferase